MGWLERAFWRQETLKGETMTEKEEEYADT